ncbi:MAG: energy-coupling factor ABC transporter ATP-binding protein [Treponema sp.]|jgi:energy-coupling factor transport system ATP-binding protein|nr:energy-coupling factor ABC transporter ATP-binding protein [Treponema sp.]
MNNTVPVIQLNHLYYRYNSGNFILNDIHLSVRGNEFTAIIGQNGCGKTTMLKNISGLARPSQGNILLRGHDTAEMDIAEIAGQVGLVMQESDRQLFESTVYDEVSFALKHAPAGSLAGGKLSASQIQEKTETALSLVGLLDKRDVFPPALGRADRIKTVFASILAMGPKIIMLDEPLAGQDQRGCDLIMEILANLQQQDYTIIMVTHNINVIAEYAQRLVVMKSGSVFMDGNPREICARTAQLAEAGILPPQITRLSQTLRKRLPLEEDALSPAELAAMLDKLK